MCESGRCWWEGKKISPSLSEKLRSFDCARPSSKDINRCVRESEVKLVKRTLWTWPQIFYHLFDREDQFLTSLAERVSREICDYENCLHEAVVARVTQKNSVDVNGKKRRKRRKHRVEGKKKVWISPNLKIPTTNRKIPHVGSLFFRFFRFAGEKRLFLTVELFGERVTENGTEGK